MKTLFVYLGIGIGAFAAIVGLVWGVHALLAHVRADGVKEGRAAAQTAQQASNAVAQAHVAAATTQAVERHARAVQAIHQTAEEAVDAIEDASDLDGALSAYGAAIDSLRAQAAAERAAN